MAPTRRGERADSEGGLRGWSVSIRVRTGPRPGPPAAHCEACHCDCDLNLKEAFKLGRGPQSRGTLARADATAAAVAYE